MSSCWTLLAQLEIRNAALVVRVVRRKSSKLKGKLLGSRGGGKRLIWEYRRLIACHRLVGRYIGGYAFTTFSLAFPVIQDGNHRFLFA